MVFTSYRGAPQRAVMPPLHESPTHLSLLASLIEGRSASESWPAFVDKYGPLLFQWATRWGASSHDAEEIMQETLILIFQKLEQYVHHPRSNFRSWLKTVAYRCWLQIQQARKEDRLALLRSRMEPDALRLIGSEAAREDLINEFDRVARSEILELASQRVQKQVEPSSWACFHLMYFEKLAGHEIAERLGMSQTAVYTCLTRVRKRMKVEIRQMDDSFEL